MGTCPCTLEILFSFTIRLNIEIMPNRCWAPGCKSNYYPKDPYIPVFKSSEDPELRQAWINALHREHGNPPKVFYVCAMHFYERDIENTIRVNDGVEIKYTK